MMRYSSWKSAIAVLAVVGLAACKTTGPDPNRAIAPTATEPPPGALVAEAWTKPPVGAKWVFSTDGEVSTSERLPDGTHGGRRVLRIAGSDGGMNLFDPDTGNWIATLDDRGIELRSAAPDIGDNNWPLFAGKTWTAEFTYRNRDPSFTIDGMTTFWRVEAEEEVTVPAGTFKTLRLQSRPGHRNAVLITRWYAPELGLNVKRHYQRTNRHYRGASDVFERVLVSYSLLAAPATN